MPEHIQSLEMFRTGKTTLAGRMNSVARQSDQTTSVTEEVWAKILVRMALTKKNNALRAAVRRSAGVLFASWVRFV